jgi:putative transposase
MFRKPKLREFCKDVLYLVARRHNIQILELAVMPDHIHLVAQLPPWMSQSKATQLLKGASSHKLFKLIPNFRLRYPRGSLWSKGNFKESVGRTTTEKIKQYIKNQQLTLTNLLIKAKGSYEPLLYPFRIDTESIMAVFA